MRLDGAVVLVTGDSSGIGAAIAGALQGSGARLLLAGRDTGRLAAVAARTGGTPLLADLADPQGPAVLADAAEQAAPGGIDVLISNAGLGWAGPATAIPAGRARELLAVNLAAPMELTARLLPGMIERRRGRVVFVSSIAGMTGVSGEAVYAAAKAGLAMFAECLRYETRPRGVGVTVVVPGVIDTPFFSRRGAAYSRTWPTPIPAERVAHATVHALAHDRQTVYVPGWLRGPAWLHGVAPGMFRALAARSGPSSV